MIKKEKRNGKDVWVLYSKDGSKLLGVHPSKAAAIKQDYAVRISKARAAGHKIPKKK